MRGRNQDYKSLEEWKDYKIYWRIRRFVKRHQALAERGQGWAEQ